MPLTQPVPVLPPHRKKAGVAYICTWMSAASASILVLAAHSESNHHVDVSHVALFLLVTAAADALVLHLHHGRSTEFLSLLEGAICMTILLFPPLVALGTTLGGALVSNLLHRRHPLKIFFNLSQYAVATVAAIALSRLLSTGPGFGWRSLLGLAVGMMVFGIINSVSVAGLVSILERRPFKKMLLEGRLISTLTVLGNTALGILAGVMWVSEPGLTVLFIGPAAILHLAYRGVVRTSELLETVESERDRLNRIIVGASDGITLIDAEGRIDVWSPAMTTLTGVSEGEARGSLVSSVLVGTGTDGDPVDLVSLLDQPVDPAGTVEMILSQRDGGTRVVRIRHSVLFGADGDCTGDAMIVHDVTREYETDRLKDDFLARVSHELRTPLTPIKGYAQTLLRRGEAASTDLRNQALTSIVERVDHMQALIEDLLLVSRIVAGHARLEDQIRAQTVDLAELCRTSLGSFRMAEPARQLDLEVVGTVPKVTADPARVDQILTNLVSNACKYSATATPVKIVLRNEGDLVALDVIDHGHGISPDQLHKVFERFFRSEDPLTMTTGGAGLGLYISQELALAMRGDLAVSSAPGHGSTFTLRVPVDTSFL